MRKLLVPPNSTINNVSILKILWPNVFSRKFLALGITKGSGVTKLESNLSVLGSGAEYGDQRLN